MLTRLLINWPYKLAALVIAIALRVYVSHVNDPHTSKQINIPVILNSVPSGLYVADATPNVTLQLSGPVSSLDSVTASSYVASVDLHNARSGVSQPLPILVTAAPGVPSDIALESQSPRVATVTLENEIRKRLAVQATFQSVAPAGLSYGAPKVVPPIATVQGPESAINRVARLVVRGEDAVGGETAEPGLLDGFGRITAMDSQQAPVEGVTVVPEQVEVRIPVTRESATKDMIVNAAVTGTPAYPAQITSVDVQPERLSVAGAPDMLARTSVVATEPVDVTGASSDQIKQVAVSLPPGLKAADGAAPTVTVTVHIAQPPAAH